MKYTFTPYPSTISFLHNNKYDNTTKVALKLLHCQSRQLTAYKMSRVPPVVRSNSTNTFTNPSFLGSEKAPGFNKFRFHRKLTSKLQISLCVFVIWPHASETLDMFLHI